MWRVNDKHRRVKVKFKRAIFVYSQISFQNHHLTTKTPNHDPNLKDLPDQPEN